MFRHRFFLLFVIILLSLVSACNKKNEENLTQNDIPTISEQSDDELSNEPVLKIKNPLTGLDMDLKYEGQRPLAVMIENEYNARPQSGLNVADIVYEIPTEGGITRFLAIYSHEPYNEIGPVRSARPYFIEYSMEYDAIYVHYGSSPQGYQDLKKLKIHSIDGIYDTVTFWRDTSRKKPHNAYTNTANILATSEKRGFLKEVNQEFWQFNDGDNYPDDQKLDKFKITYYKNYKVGYTYDSEKKAYARSINGKPHYDRPSEETITVKNIIVQFVNARVVDEVGRLDINTISSGKGYYISNGYATEIKWKKESKSERTRFYDLEGEEISLNAGNTWIQLIPQWGSFSHTEEYDG
jgi:hypothetical protein